MDTLYLPTRSTNDFAEFRLIACIYLVRYDNLILINKPLKKVRIDLVENTWADYPGQIIFERTLSVFLEELAFKSALHYCPSNLASLPVEREIFLRYMVIGPGLSERRVRADVFDFWTRGEAIAVQFFVLVWLERNNTIMNIQHIHLHGIKGYIRETPTSQKAMGFFVRFLFRYLLFSAKRL